LFSNNALLSSSAVRRDALDILGAGVTSVLIEPAMRSLLSLDGDNLLVAGHGCVPLPPRCGPGRLFVVAVGKAALAMAKSFERVVEQRVHDGFAIGTDAVERAADLVAIRYVRGSHPLPCAATLSNTDALLDMLRTAELTAVDLVVFLLSGGASALLEKPRCSLEQLTAINKALLRCGTDIQQTNTVRKHLSLVKGGQLALRALPARQLSLIVSDVIASDVSVIGSGPTTLDMSTLADVRGVVERFQLHAALLGQHASADDLLRDFGFAETPKDAGAFERVTNVVLISNAVAVDAMRVRAQALGYVVDDRGVTLCGEARALGRQFAHDLLRPGVAAIGAGETTVTVCARAGRGGRNQEFALGAVGHLVVPGVVCALGTDGNDNGPVAGALVDNDTPAERAADFLARNDATTFFEQCGGEPCQLIINDGNGTGTNVADVFLALGRKRDQAS
jgi:glycerate 2-kinase